MGVLAALFVPAALPAGQAQSAPSIVRPNAPSPDPARLPAYPRTVDQAAWRAWQKQSIARQTPSARPAEAGATGTIETLAGSAPFQAPAAALKTGIGAPDAVVADASGNLYIAISTLSVVLKVDTSGNLTVYAGQAFPDGPFLSNTGDGGPATAARLDSPVALAVDASGNLYIADHYVCTVRKVDAAGGTISTVAGTGTCNDTGDGGPATGAELMFPVSISLDGQGNLFIAETNPYASISEPVREVNLATGIISTFAGATGGGGPSCFLIGNQTCPATSVQLQTTSIVAGPNSLYIAAFLNDYVFAPSSGAIVSAPYGSGTMQIVAGGGVFGNGIAGDNLNGMLALDAAGNLYDTGVGLIQELAPGASAFTTVVGNGAYGFSGDGGLATLAPVEHPVAVNVSPQGSLVFVDNERVRSVSGGGIITTLAGNGTFNDSGDSGPATHAGLALPTDTVIDSQGNLYIADRVNNVVRKVDGSTGLISTLAGIADPQTNFPNGPPFISGAGGPALQAPILNPSSLALDNTGNLYIGAAQGIASVNLATGVLSILNGSALPEGGMVFDGKQTLYATSGFANQFSDTVLAIDLPSGTATTIAGGGTATGDGGPATDASIAANGIALDGNGNLYIADTDSIKIVNLATGIIETFAGGSKLGYTGDGGPAINATFSLLGGLRYDGNGHLLVTDSGNCALRSIDLSTNIITTVAGTGTSGFTGDGAPATAADLANPRAVANDAAGNLFLADYGNDRVRRIILHPTALTPTLTASSTSPAAGAPVTFTATYSGIQYGIAPTATVTFYAGAMVIGSAPLTATAPTSFTASLTSSSLAAGSQSITAQFAGDLHYAAGTSADIMLTVSAPAPSFTLAAAPATLTVAQGSTGTTVLTVIPQNGFNQAVTFSCGSGLPTGVTCSFSPSSVTPTSSASVTTTLTLTTTAATTAALTPNARPASSWWLPGSGSLLACVMLIALPSRKRWQPWLCVFLATTALSAMLGCGGSGSPPANPNATPPGAYTVTANAVVAGVTTETLSITLTVTK